jgi:hypothetical protein
MPIMLLTFLTLINACIKSNQPIGPGSGYCDTTNITYSRNVLPILESYCYPCHSNTNMAFSNGISLEGYKNTKDWAGTGYLIGDITHQAGFIGNWGNGGIYSGFNLSRVFNLNKRNGR